MIVRAFLSHTSADKEFVRAVAKRLGRVISIFDEASFNTGEDLVEQIDTKLTESTLFVLFASRKSLQSEWVQFEVAQAVQAKARRLIKEILVIPIESDIKPSDLPKWLTQSIFRFCPSANLASRSIRSRLELVQARHLPEKFVGRLRELNKCETALGSVGSFPHVVAFYGLDGIGRRTLCRRITRDLLQLQRIVLFDISSADSLSDLVFRIQFQLEPPSSPDRVKRLRAGFESSSETELVRTLQTAMDALLLQGELPVFLDDGGIIGHDGGFTDVVATLLRAVGSSQGPNAALITNRRPPEQVDDAIKVASIDVRPLSLEETERLLTLLLRQTQLKLDRAKISALAKRINGFPPHAYYATKLVERLGFDVVERRQYFEEIQASSFLRYLDGTVALTETAMRILHVLASYSPLPAIVVERCLSLESQQCGETLSGLIDLTLVAPDSDGLYGISGPVKAAVNRVLGSSEVPHNHVAKHLQAFLESVPDDERELVLCEHLFKASAVSETEPTSWAIRFARDLLDLAWRFYRDTEYERAVEFARLVASERPSDYHARECLVRGLIQCERFDEANVELRFFSQQGMMREFHFLSGFRQRKRQQLPAAIRHYKLAQEAGRKGIALHRELALCYFLQRDLDSARQHIRIASDLDPDNRFLVDLRLKIALARGDIETAVRIANMQESVDRPAFVAFRRSMIAYLESDGPEALRLAEDATRLAAIGGKPTFEMWSQLAKCQIAQRELAKASGTLTDIDRIFKGRRSDVRHGLWIKWHIAEQNWDEADSRWKALDDKQRPVHSAMRKQIIEGYLASSGLDAARRDEYEKELSRVTKDLEKVGEDAVLYSELAEDLL